MNQRSSSAPTGRAARIVVVGAKAHPLRDLYHRLLVARWPTAIGGIAGAFLILNCVFATGYVVTGGIEGKPGHGDFLDAFFFSAQTLGTIGYGAMHPVSLGANALVVVETIVGILFIALATGIVFARFSRTGDSIAFCDHPCISRMDGVPTLYVRVGNDRDATVVEARFRVAYTFTHTSTEGHVIYRMVDLPLVRDLAPNLARSWTLMHVIDAASPLHGMTPEAFREGECELLVSVIGTDGTSLQPIHGQRRYGPGELRWGSRFVDVLTERPNGDIEIDVGKFHLTCEAEGEAHFGRRG